VLVFLGLGLLAGLSRLRRRRARKQKCANKLGFHGLPSLPLAARFENGTLVNTPDGHPSESAAAINCNHQDASNRTARHLPALDPTQTGAILI
jgi:hypothetical protein